MNAWYDNRDRIGSLLSIRYEDLQESAAKALRATLEFLDIRDVRPGVIDRAVEAARFQNMQELERSGKHDWLKPGDVNDPDSFKVRRGKIGGYRDYVGPDTARYMDEQLQKLRAGFGYGSATANLS